MASQEKFNNNLEGDKNNLLGLMEWIETLNTLSLGRKLLQGESYDEGLRRMTEELEKATEEHGEILDKVGIKLELRQSHYGEFDNFERNFDVTVDIADKDTFIQYLSHITVGELDKDTTEGLIQLGRALDNQITDYYDVNKGEDEFLTLSTALKDVAEQYTRLSVNSEDLASYAEAFSKYSQAMSGKFFKEYLKLYEVQFEYRIDFFNPEYRHIEQMVRRYTPSDFQEVWDEILSTVKECSKNKNAHQFLQAALGKIQLHLTRVKQELKDRPNNIREPEKADDYLIVIDDVYSQIEEIAMQMHLD